MKREFWSNKRVLWITVSICLVYALAQVGELYTMKRDADRIADSEVVRGSRFFGSIPPARACALLDDLHLKTMGRSIAYYRHDGCSTPSGNSLVYAVTATDGVVSKFQLTLTVRYDAHIADPHAPLRKAAEALSMRAAMSPLPTVVLDSIQEGRELVPIDVAGVLVSITRQDWKSKEGYVIYLTFN